MASKEDQPLYDAIMELDGGVDSGRTPQLLARNQVAWAVNATNRGGFVNTRPVFRKINLNNPLPSGLFQEAQYYQPDGSTECLFTSISGRLLQIIPDNSGNATVLDLTPASGGQLSSVSQHWMWQSEQFLIWNDGVSLPLFYDGAMVRRSLGFGTGPAGQTVYGTIAAAPPFVIPAVGSTVIVNLTGTPTSTFAQAVNINGDDYEVAPYNPNSSVLSPSGVVLTNLFDTPGNIHNVGENVLLIPDYLAVITDPQPGGLSTGATIIDNAATGAAHINFSKSFKVDYLVNLTVGQFIIVPGIAANSTGANAIVQVFQINPMDNTVIVTGTYSGIATSSGHGGVPFLAPVINVAYGTIIATAYPKYINTPVGALSAAFTVPAVGQQVTVSLSNLYVGSIQKDGWIGKDHYLFTTYAGSAANTAALTLIALASGHNPGDSMNGMVIYSLPELPAGRMGDYGWGRNWQSWTDAISYMGTDIVGSHSGCNAYGYRDAVLKMTQNTTLLAGYFRVPGDSGKISGLKFPAQLDTSLGQGPLQVFTQRSVFSCNAPIALKDWQDLNNPLQTEALKGAGASSHWSLALNNADIFFRSSDGQIRSLLLARMDFNQWGDTPIGYEMTRVLDNENDNLLNFISTTIFDNRMLMTARPTQSGNGVYHPEIMGLNFDTVSSIGQKSPPVYEGVWHGLNVLKLVTGFFSGVQRCFAFHLNLTNNQIELWEIMPSTQAQTDGGITLMIETPCFFSQNPPKSVFVFCQLLDGELFVDNLTEKTLFNVEFRPDSETTWYPWYSWEVDPVITPDYKTRMGFGTPPNTDTVSTMRLSRTGYFFQLRITIAGECEIRGVRLKAAILPQPDFAPQIQDTLTVPPARP